MNDIEKMKAEMEQKIKWAEMENELSKKLPDGVRVSIIGDSLTQKGKLHTMIWAVPGLTEHQVGEILNAFPVTEKVSVYNGNGNYSFEDYAMTTHRYVCDCYTELHIEWISDDLVMSIKVHIDKCSDEIKQFFTKTYRDVNQEWTGPKTRYNKATRDRFEFYTFVYGRVIGFQGGYHKQVADFALNDIVVKFKYLAEFSE